MSWLYNSNKFWVCLSIHVADSCTFHPGQPVFHDALKGWSCCKKRSTDFTEFLNTPVNVYWLTLSAQHKCLPYCINGFTELFYMIIDSMNYALALWHTLKNTKAVICTWQQEVLVIFCVFAFWRSVLTFDITSTCSTFFNLSIRRTELWNTVGHAGKTGLI